MMIITAKAGAVKVNHTDQVAWCDTACPPRIASSTSTKPISDTSSTLPGRRKRRYSPMNTAIGIVIAMVNVPQGLALSAFTTISAATPSRMMMMLITATKATNPPTRPISSRAIWPRDLPSRRTENSRITKSCTHPPNTAPARIQIVPGK